MVVSVLIVTYNSAQYIERCITSFLHINLRMELIIVDNDSKDSTSAIVNRIKNQHPTLNIIYHGNASNLGFSKAMNVAYDLAIGDYILTFNPDAEMLPKTLESMVAFLKYNEMAGKVGVPILNTKGELELPETEFRKYPKLQIIRALRAKQSEKQLGLRMQKVNAYKVDWLFGTGFLIKRSAITGNGLYPEKSFLFWEEYYLSRKIRENGYSLFVLPTVHIKHHASTSFKYNYSKLYMARLLSFAHEYLVRSEYYGKLNAVINMALYTLDNFLLSTYLTFKSFLVKNDPELRFTNADYRARSRSTLRILFSNKQSIAAIDSEAAAFFKAV